MSSKKRPKESLRNDLEKEIMYGFKEEFLQQDVKLAGLYKVDRGKLITSWIEGGFLDTSDIKRPLLKRALSRIGVVIYRRASPREKPYIIFLVDTAAKRAAADSANEAAGIFKHLFPGTKTVFVAIDKEPEKLKPSRFKFLDKIIIGRDLEEAWNGVYDYLKQVFYPEEK